MSGYISEAGIVAIEKARTAGYVVGPEWLMGMMALRRKGTAEPHVWLDVGDTVRIVGHESDVGELLYFEIIGLFDGPERVQRARDARKPPQDKSP